ncbi:diflavin oxidoreductase [Undibacter mobilis]|uniref:assimilatory sulfite reductase (NADPH) n=1 Tax=Undibacter mobilis TaxID=2292256 RepID=A0A371BAB5_9BRAD|nr:flavodoxin domain-containing protein [Undibacter mobilis]RDV04343.1 sulfite reductase subunit alpha [Undibacter mobilis]
MAVVQIPKTAPFDDGDIALLNQVVGGATPTQRAWLAGFLAGVESVSGDVAEIASPVTIAAEPLTIVFATESGNSERLANDIARTARKGGLKPSVIDLADLDMTSLKSVRRLVFVAATWGEGEPPSRVAAKYNELMTADFGRLDGVEYAVLALGDTSYAEFCAIGRKIDERLAALGGKRVVDRADCDLDFEKPAAAWTDKVVKALAPPEAARGKIIPVEFGKAAAVKPDIVEAEIVELTNLNSSRSDKETVHLALRFTDAVLPYEPGDSLDLYVENDPAEVDALLKAAGLSDDKALRDELISQRDIHTLSLKSLETYATATNHQYVKGLIEQGEARDWIPGRQLIDLVSNFPIALKAEHLRAVTRTLAPRAYSVASSRRENEEEAHLLISAVRYETHGHSRKGVASTYVAERRKRGDKVRVKLRSNKHFRLPADGRDIIMVGPGTGIAPFRAFVQERRAAGAKGRSWLFFGDRHFTHDFLYQLEWQEALKDGGLTRMDVAFSRDQPEKVYVQDRIWERRRDIVEWLDGGANFYVCGDAKAMAKDVRASLVRAYQDVKSLSAEAAEAAVAEVERDKRYLTDTY